VAAVFGMLALAWMAVLGMCLAAGQHLAAVLCGAAAAVCAGLTVYLAAKT
jgi:hypothetical protein